MSLSELLIVLVVTLCLIEPKKDIPTIISKCKDFRTFFTELKENVLSFINLNYRNDSCTEYDDEFDQVNFYLERILELGGSYDGEYCLKSVKNHYQELVQEFIKSGKSLQ